MPPPIASSAIAVPAPANLSAGPAGRHAADEVRSQELWGVAEAFDIVAARSGLARALRFVLTVLVGFGESIAVAYAFALAILAVGIPVALFVQLVMWSVRLL